MADLYAILEQVRPTAAAAARFDSTVSLSRAELVEVCKLAAIADHPVGMVPIKVDETVVGWIDPRHAAGAMAARQPLSFSIGYSVEPMMTEGGK